MARLNPPPVKRTLAIGLAVFLVLMGAWELYLRATPRRFSGTVAAVAAAARVERPPRPGTGRILLLGSSRTGCGTNPETLELALGNKWTVYMAAISAGDGLCQLEESTDFLRDGDIVVIDVLPVATYEESVSELLKVYIRALERQQNVRGAIDVWARRQTNQRLAMGMHEVTPLRELHMELRRHLLREERRALMWKEHTNGRRELVLDEEGARRLHKMAEQEKHETPVASVEDRHLAWKRRLDRFEVVTHALRRQGVTIVFLRMPSEGDYARHERETYPRQLFWDELARRYPGHCWHFEDFAETRDLKTIDESHLYHEQAETYTRWLAMQLQETVLRD